jgi:hypothetical protein
MGGVLTRWSIAHDRPVHDGDLSRDGTVTSERLGAWVDAAVAAYLDQCAAVRRAAGDVGFTLVRRLGRVPKPSLLGQPTDVLVTASATEVRPAEFIISVRIRPFGGDMDLPLNVTCAVSIEDIDTGEKAELGKEIRDELIALEHAAHHMN